MCGRFFFFGDGEAVQMSFPELELPPVAMAPRYNIAPRQPVAVIANSDAGKLDHFLWGLVPSWAKDPGIGNRLLNAHAETLAEKPAFRTALRRRRCLILADGFYEWYLPTEQHDKIPLLFQLRPPRLFAFAGLWEVWQSSDGSILLLLRHHHHRRQRLDRPLSSAHAGHPPAILLRRLARPQRMLARGAAAPAGAASPEEMEAYPVSTMVNNARVDAPECIEPVGEVITFES